MSLFISSLNSGSNANCYYVGNAHEAILIDAGLSGRETVKRMKILGLKQEHLKAIFISHEHRDHISGLEALQKKLHIPIYITEKTKAASGITLQKELVFSFHAKQKIQIGEIIVEPFLKWHDAADPYSFFISYKNIHVAVITDIGHACEEVKTYFKKCDAAFLEANYCETMLKEGDYPFHLKKRISGNSGHLSNHQALELFLQHRSQKLKLLILSHLSKNNNRPEIVSELFKPHAAETEIFIASRDKESEVFEVLENKQVLVMQKSKTKTSHQQLSLFEF